LIAASFALAVLACATSASADPGSPKVPAGDDDLELPASGAPPARLAAPPVPPAVPAPPAAPTAPKPAEPTLLPPARGTDVGPAVVDPKATEIAELRARLDALEARVSNEPPHPLIRGDLFGPKLPTTSFDASPWARTWPVGLVLSGYVQAQYQQSQLSSDQLSADGANLNQNRFLVRRARLRLDRAWEFAYATLEVDGNNVNGFAFGLRRAEAGLIWRAKDSAAPPLLMLRTGLMDIPFGYELFEPNRTRLFLERTTASRAFFPGETDFGAQLSGAIGVFRYALGAFDGTPVSDTTSSAAGIDFTSEKDFMARFGAETQPSKNVGVSGGVSVLNGTGIHAGTVATKGSLQWNDLNGNGVVDTGEITGLPGQSATPSATYSRWAVGVDLQARIKTPIGRGMLYGEAYIASNYDRGLLIADPVVTGVSLREVGWYVAYVQEVTRWGLVGLRVDGYNPNGDATAQRGASLLPVDQSITTWSPLVGLVLPDHARLVFEYDRILNHSGLNPSGVPTQLQEDQWALRLQVEL
jgi:hypothetical protein